MPSKTRDPCSSVKFVCDFLFPFLFLNYTLVKLFYGLPLDKEPWLAARASSLGGSSAAIPLSQESKLMFLDVIPYKQNKQK